MKYLILILGLLCLAPLHAQEVNGVVTQPDNAPLELVTVYNLNSRTHTHTLSNGSFTISQTRPGDSLQFSLLGYASRVIKVASASVLNVTLEPASISLDQITLTAPVNALTQIADIDLRTDPVKSSQEILRKVPGLFIGQHAGGGKAEQIFLRGFDVDHGTDVALTVDGMPVNMVSHAHGQGYADLHFVIPETIENIDFGKGPYYANQGNFNTAGYVDLRLKDRITENSITAEGGQFNTTRLVSMLKVLDKPEQSGYVASEVYLTDGPFEAPQNFNRLNILTRWNFLMKDGGSLQLTASHFDSKWDASGQIPQRAVDQGLITRFGAIDPTEGGNTSRTNLQLEHRSAVKNNQQWLTRAFVSRYDFELYSNFTFFLEDPVNGDQIRQKENRLLLGAQTQWHRSALPLGDSGSLSYRAGTGFRFDKARDVELSFTRNRQETLRPLALGDIDEFNGFAWTDATFRWGAFSMTPSLRMDLFRFDYYNRLSETYDNRSEDQVFVSPKLSLAYQINPDWQWFLKMGRGFHSNDTRVVVANEGRDILPAAYGADFGTAFKPTSRLLLNATLWYLFLEQEFVYVGDAAIVEPSGKTRRFGLEAGARYQMTDWLFAYADLQLTSARATEEPDEANRIPLAPGFLSTGGLTVQNLGNFSGGISYRFMDDRPANEDNSIVAEGYFVTDLNLNYTVKDWTFGIVVENLFDTDWNETQFATESRLFDEPASVEEIHFTPGTPFYLRGRLTYRF